MVIAPVRSVTCVEPDLYKVQQTVIQDLSSSDAHTFPDVFGKPSTARILMLLALYDPRL